MAGFDSSSASEPSGAQDATEGGESDAREVDELEREIKRLGRAITSAERDLARHESHLGQRAEADLLATWLHLVPKGAERVQLTAYGEDGSERVVEVELDPSLSPSRNLSSKYVGAAKAERGHSIAAGRVADLRERREVARLQLAVIRARVSDPEVPHAGMERASSPKPRPRSSSDKQSVSAASDETELHRGADAIPKHLRPRVCHAEDGTMILVGRSEAGNDYLTTRIANGNDIFFHVAGTPGSHVILRWGNKGGLPGGAAMEDAALLASHFSKMKDASRVSVSYAPKKQVHKPKGARPGLVVVNRPKSITVRRDPARLARLLGKEVGSE